MAFSSGGRTFNLQHAISSACLIPLDQEFVIVGGFSAGVAAKVATRWWQQEKYCNPQVYLDVLVQALHCMFLQLI